MSLTGRPVVMADPVAFGPYGPTAAHGSIVRTCVCDCQQAGDEPSCWNCGRPARGTRTLLQLTAN